MNVTRGEFLQLSAGFTGFLITSSAFNLVKVPEAFANMGPKVGAEVTSICYGCACGCGVLATVKNHGAPNAKLKNVEGDPVHPVNEGALCSKCQSIFQMVNHKMPNAQLPPEGAFLSEWDPNLYRPDGSMKVARSRRVARCLYRAAGGTGWQVLNWTNALTMIGARVAATRAATWEDMAGGMKVNRTTGIACFGGAAHDNQECYLLRKLMTGLGLVYIEHQARI